MQGKKISFTIHNFKFKYVRQKESTWIYTKKRDCSQSREMHGKKTWSQLDLLLAVVLGLESEGL